MTNMPREGLCFEKTNRSLNRVHLIFLLSLICYLKFVPLDVAQIPATASMWRYMILLLLIVYDWPIMKDIFLGASLKDFCRCQYSFWFDLIYLVIIIFFWIWDVSSDSIQSNISFQTIPNSTFFISYILSFDHNCCSSKYFLF